VSGDPYQDVRTGAIDLSSYCRLRLANDGGIGQDFPRLASSTESKHSQRVFLYPTKFGPPIGDRQCAGEFSAVQGSEPPCAADVTEARGRKRIRSNPKTRAAPTGRGIQR